MRLVSVVTSTRSPIATRSLISDSKSSTWSAAGRTSTSGSTSPVGRTTCSTTSPERSSSYALGVAETKMTCPARSSHSSNRRGRLSSADGSRNP